MLLSIPSTMQCCWQAVLLDIAAVLSPLMSTWKHFGSNSDVFLSFWSSLAPGRAHFGPLERFPALLGATGRACGRIWKAIGRTQKASGCDLGTASRFLGDTLGAIWSRFGINLKLNLQKSCRKSSCTKLLNHSPLSNEIKVLALQEAAWRGIFPSCGPKVQLAQRNGSPRRTAVPHALWEQL